MLMLEAANKWRGRPVQFGRTTCARYERFPVTFAPSSEATDEDVAQIFGSEDAASRRR